MISTKQLYEIEFNNEQGLYSEDKNYSVIKDLVEEIHSLNLRLAIGNNASRLIECLAACGLAKWEGYAPAVEMWRKGEVSK